MVLINGGGVEKTSTDLVHMLYLIVDLETMRGLASLRNHTDARMKLRLQNGHVRFEVQRGGIVEPLKAEPYRTEHCGYKMIIKMKLERVLLRSENKVQAMVELLHEGYK
jgi:hypothetical protein